MQLPIPPNHSRRRSLLALAALALAPWTACAAGEIMAYRYWQLVPERPELSNLKRWYEALKKRQAFREHVEAIKLA